MSQRTARALVPLAALLAVASVVSPSPVPAGAAELPPWQGVVGGVVGDPVVVGAFDLGHSDAFVRTGTSLFHQRALRETTLEQDLGGITQHNPAAASTEDGTYVFVTGINGAVYYRLVADGDGAAGPWTTLGGISRRAPTAVTDERGFVHVFVAGADGAVWTRQQGADGGWTAWQSIGGITTSDVAVEVGFWPVTPYLRLAVRGVDGALWTNEAFDGTWIGYRRFGGRIVGSPAIAQGSIAVRGVDNQVYLASGANNLFPTGGFITGDPTMVEPGPYSVLWRLVVSGRGPDGAIYSEWWGRGRSGWGRIESNISSRVADVVLDPLTLCNGSCGARRLYVTAPDGALYTLFD